MSCSCLHNNLFVTTFYHLTWVCSMTFVLIFEHGIVAIDNIFFLHILLQAETTVINQCTQLLSPSADPTYVVTYISHSFPQHRQYLCAGAWILMHGHPESINSANLVQPLFSFLFSLKCGLVVGGIILIYVSYAIFFSYF